VRFGLRLETILTIAGIWYAELDEAAEAVVRTSDVIQLR
jgi:hypothetical protein